ncbi:MAG: type I secretion system permease/ATPase [Oceanospirillaceae bacterium]|nr:type I secretion system permease/ATPase [Oceanospirillaceae bacterium]
MNKPYHQSASNHWFFGPVIRSKRLYMQVILASVFINLFALASAFYIMTVYDRVIPNEAMESLLALTIGVCIVMAFDFIMKVLRGVFTDQAGINIDHDVADSLFDRLAQNDNVGGQKATGAMANTVKDFDSLKDFLASASFVVFADLPFVFLFIFVLYSIGGPIATIPGVIVIAVLLVGLLVQPIIKRLTFNAMQDGQSKQAVLVEVLNSLETIKTLSGIRLLRNRWMDSVGRQGVVTAKSRFWTQLTTNFSQLGQQASQVGIVVYGVVLITSGDLTMGSLIACVILSGRTMAPLGQLTNLLGRFNQSVNAYKNLNELMSEPVMEASRLGQIRREKIIGEIKFTNTSFRYPEQKQDTLKQLNLHIKAGEKVAILGKIGSGKTSLLRLLAGIYEPNEGSVQIDQTEVSHIHPEDLRSGLGVVLQTPMLFSGSVKENLLLGKPDATDENIIEAAKQAGIDEFIGQLPDGYETILTERGQQLSGGQRQAMCIARSLISNPSVIIMDEPTSAMDSGTEQQLMFRLKALFENKTVIVITHRGTLLSLVDRVIVMDSGRIVADGPKEEVLKSAKTGTQS